MAKKLGCRSVVPDLPRAIPAPKHKRVTRGEEVEKFRTRAERLTVAVIAISVVAGLIIVALSIALLFHG